MFKARVQSLTTCFTVFVAISAETYFGRPTINLDGDTVMNCIKIDQDLKLGKPVLRIDATVGTART